ncbi:hypothetical protein F5Y01DRAFT_307187 [Xylaria sp. FL0043]|nr:hypothetical protein F5Y01DRAFT_307187 [Xylaria sp. FL0043]
MSRLPVKAQVGIRNAWDNQDSPAQRAIKKFKEAIGVQISVIPEWPILVTELGPFYPDKEILVLSIAAAVEACVTALTSLADDESNSEWADTLLERTASRVRLLLETSKSRELGIAWSDEQKGLVISLPKSAIPSQSYMLSFFTGSLIKVFDEKEKHSISSKIESTAADDWADVAVDNKTGNAAVIETPQRHATTEQSLTFDLIPDVNIIPRPDELLLKPPYYLTVRDFSSSSTEVQCSHSPTLQFLSDYVKKWAKTNYNHTNKPPLAEVELHQSVFGLGIVYDRMTIKAESRYTTQEVSPTIILALVEGVLGYKVISNDGPYWSFRRDVEFRNTR